MNHNLNRLPPGGRVLLMVLLLAMLELAMPTRAAVVAANGTGSSLPSSAVSVRVRKPSARQIFQRNAANRADIPIQGTFTGTITRIEARAVMMPGATNNGANTDWTIIAAPPVGGAFSGTLPSVVAGGWYQLEVQAFNEEAIVAQATVARVGVGDLLVTAGQSNAACFGSPAQTLSDDRVSAYILASDTWRTAADPQPDNSGGMGSGGSPWPILGSMLTQSNQVPTGLVGLAYGGTALTDWAPGTGNYRNLTNSLRRLGVQGVRAVLWHQGESDSLAATSAATYAQRLNTIITQSRAAAGWLVPWGIAEASFHPSATRAMEEPVAAGQRALIYAGTNIFRGPRTDDFNLEGKLSDTVHFNAAGLREHARQWFLALNGIEELTPKNGDFETGPALADGALYSNKRVIGWNQLNAAGTALAAGNNGVYNPDARYYSNSVDTINGGVMPNMNGRRVAYLFSNTASNAFFQTLRASLLPSTIYTITVAVGVRDNGSLFGGYQVALLANGKPLGPATAGYRATLDALAGGDASGRFLVISNTYTSPPSVAPNQQLAVRITKPASGTASTYLDFDDLRVTSRLTPYGQWQTDNWGSVRHPASAPEADLYHDGVANLVKFAFGLNPTSQIQTGVSPFTIVRTPPGSAPFVLVRRRHPGDSGLVYVLESSKNLSVWMPETNAQETAVSLGNGFEDAVFSPASAAGWGVEMLFFRLGIHSP